MDSRLRGNDVWERTVTLTGPSVPGPADLRNGQNLHDIGIAASTHDHALGQDDLVIRLQISATLYVLNGPGVYLIDVEGCRIKVQGHDAPAQTQALQGLLVVTQRKYGPT